MVWNGSANDCAVQVSMSTEKKATRTIGKIWDVERLSCLGPRGELWNFLESVHGRMKRHVIGAGIDGLIETWMGDVCNAKRSVFRKEGHRPKFK
jgi:hypothetical protein